jgi:acetyl esterase/lipase
LIRSRVAHSLAVALVALCLGCAAHKAARTPAGSTRIAYGTDPAQQFGELFVPEGNGPFPLVVLIHGGCWLSRYGLNGTTPLAQALSHEGVAVWNIEYRRVGNPGGGWPGTFLDVADATDFARTLVKKAPLDLSRVIVLGHSAGGHLALWDAARPKLEPSSQIYRPSPLPLRGVIAMAGPGDLRVLGRLGDGVCGRDTLYRLTGGTLLAEPRHYADGSPAALLPLGLRQVLIVGSDDGIVPPGLVKDYQQAAQTAGDSVAYFELPGLSHLDPIDPSSQAWETVRAQVLALVAKH